jgi:lipoprotein-anchoring transpeptidase ErfK/SrfK
VIPVIAGTVVLMISGIAAVVVLLLLISTPADRIRSGVEVGSVELSGLSEAEARDAIANALSDSPITLQAGDVRVSLTSAELGISIDAEYLAAAAREADRNTAIEPVYTIDLELTQQSLLTVADAVYREPSTSEPGRALEIPTLLDALRIDPTSAVRSGIIDLPMIELPVVTGGPAVVNYTGETTTHIVQSGEELGLIARQYNVTTADIAAMNGIADVNLIFAGQELVIPAAGIYEPSAADAPPPATSTGRSLVVSVSQQRIYAYENGQLVHSHLVSTGLPETPTVLGDFAVYVKYTATDMRGPGYYLPDVPYTMYFYQGYGIHGTYWHNNFGRPMSHGCVNLPTEQAQWFFNFASVGTPVRVIA